MKPTKLFLLTAAVIGLSGTAMAQNATQIQQQRTEAASAGQAARTNAAAQAQAQKTQAATMPQDAKTLAATQEQAQRTQAAVQKQADETNAALRAQPGQPQLNQPYLYDSQPVSTGGAIVYGLGSAVGAASAPSAYNVSPPNQAASASNPAEKQLQDLFNTIDKDHNGMISKTEFSIYYSSPPQDPRFDGYDTNRDMMISYFEFRAPNVSGGTVGLPTH
jgi:hypothetical protein